MIHPHLNKKYIRRFWRFEHDTSVVEYSAAGIVIVLVDYSVFCTLYYVLHAQLFLATAVGFIAGLIATYILNRYWVFRKAADVGPDAANIVRYMILVIINLFITYFMLLGLQRVGLVPALGKWVVNLFLYFWNYAASRYFVFKNEMDAPRGRRTAKQKAA